MPKAKLLSAKKVLEQWMALPRHEQYSANARKYAKLCGMKSILEVRTASWLEEHNIPFGYEKEKWDYQYEPQTYRPDFNLDGFTIECKGKLTKEVRKKLLAIVRCNPKKKLFLVFERPENKINRGSKTTYADWAEKNGIEWSTVVPELSWFKRKRKNG